MKKAKIVLEDGKIFEGYSFGAEGESYGEVVFNTSLSGYQEILTDPSYKGQIVTMTYPLIGNYGVNSQDVESRQPFVEGFIVREKSRIRSNWRSEKTIEEYLRQEGIMGIEGVDTRALTRHIRLRGAMKAVISTEDLDVQSLKKKVVSSQGLVGRDLVKEVSVKEPYSWNTEGRYHVVAIDCGIKYNILRILAQYDCRITVFPYTSSSQEILENNPQGVFISNGPGDPAGVDYVTQTIKNLLGKIPIFGICLGHQILALALGAKTYKLKFGHHGGNHPVKDLETGKISITTQNHGFCVDIDSLNKEEIKITHFNLNDHTLEGMRHTKLPIFSVQFHPEAGPGPHDARYLFDNFLELMERS